MTPSQIYKYNHRAKRGRTKWRQEGEKKGEARGFTQAAVERVETGRFGWRLCRRN